MDEISPGGRHTIHSKDLMGGLNTVNLTRTPCSNPCSGSEGSQSAGDTPKCLRETFLVSLANKSLTEQISSATTWDVFGGTSQIQPKTHGEHQVIPSGSQLADQHSVFFNTDEEWF